MKRCFVDEDDEERDSSVWRYSSTYKFLMNQMKTDTANVRSARERAAINVWAGWIGDIIQLWDLKAVLISNSRCRFLLIWKQVPRHTGHNEYSIRAGKSPGYLTIIKGSEEPNMFVCESSHKFDSIPRTKLSLWRIRLSCERSIFHQLNVYWEWLPQICRRRFGME